MSDIIQSQTFVDSLKDIYLGINAVIYSKLFKEKFRDVDDEDSIETLKPFFDECDCLEKMFHSQFSLHLKQYGTLSNQQIENYFETHCFANCLKEFRNAFFDEETIDDIFYDCRFKFLHSIIKLNNNPLIQKELPLLWEYDLKDVVPTKEGITLIDTVFSQLEEQKIFNVNFF